MAFFNEEVNKELNKNESSFYSLEQGQNEFRIVSDFAWGYKYNFENREEAEEKEYPFYKLSDKKVQENRHKLNLSAAMVLYDYETEQLMSFNIHQKNILNAIKGYAENDKYGDPTGYDLVITKTGEGRETRYQVIANPPEELPKKVKKALDEVEIKMENVYEGESPIVRKEE